MRLKRLKSVGVCTPPNSDLCASAGHLFKNLSNINE